MLWPDVKRTAEFCPPVFQVLGMCVGEVPFAFEIIVWMLITRHRERKVPLSQGIKHNLPEYFSEFVRGGADKQFQQDSMLHDCFVYAHVKRPFIRSHCDRLEALAVVPGNPIGGSNQEHIPVAPAESNCFKPAQNESLLSILFAGRGVTCNIGEHMRAFRYRSSGAACSSLNTEAP